MCNKQQESIVENKESVIPYEYCLNCGTKLNGMYCHVCGQQANNPTPTVRGFILEYLNNAFMWDPLFFQSLWLLVRRPGLLTREFLSGKFISYVHPLKLNMFLLFVFLTLFLSFSGTDNLRYSVQNLTEDERVYSSLQLELLMDEPEYAEKLKTSPRDTVQLHASLILAEQHPEIISNIRTIENTQGASVDRWTAVLPRVLIEDKIIVPEADGYYYFNKDVATRSKDLEIFNSVWSQMVNLAANYFPMIVLFTAPLLSFSLRIVQRKKRLSQINHFIFSLHYTAFLELFFIFIYLLHLFFSPSMALLQVLLIIGSCTYLSIAFRRFYQVARWLKAIFLSLLTSLLYCQVCLLIFFGIFLVAAFIVAGQV